MVAAEEPQRLTRLRRTATGILAALVAVFLATLAVPDPAGWVLFIRAVAEAGMVGGLADWFAVEAIFRHPLRIPIPHTALLRHRKDEAAENIGRFIKEYILVPEQIAENVQRIDPAARIADWLADRNHADHIAGLILEGLEAVTAQGPQGRFAQSVRKLVRALLRESRDNTELTQLLSDILQRGASGRGFDQVIAQVAEYVDDSRAHIAHLVRENSRWWVAAPVDKKVADLIVDAIVNLLGELSQPDTETRAQFEGLFREFVVDLERKGAVTAFLLGDDDGALDALAARISNAGAEVLGVLLTMRGQDGGNPVRSAVTDALVSVADMLRDDPGAAQSLNDRLLALVREISDAHRSTIGGYVADTLKSWDADLLIARVEAEVGSDLQFIRINGAILGGCIGGLIFALERLLGA